MKRFIAVTCAIVGSSGPITGLQPATGQADRPLVIQNTTVVSVGDATLLPSMTIVIRADRIAAVGPAADVVIPPNARVIDGTGKFVVPGFIDLHAHVSKTRASALELFVAHGVTTVRDMGGDHEELVQWRRDIRGDRRIGPRLLIAGPYLESASNIERMRKDPPEARVEPFDRIRIGIATPDEARRVVARLASQELDFLKFRTVQDRETYLALNEAANAHGIRLVGHVSGIPPDVVLAAGQDGLDHPFYPSLAGQSRDARLAVWRGFRDRRVPMVPTLVTLFEATFPPADRLKALANDDEGRLDPRRAYVSKFLGLDWREQADEASETRTAMLRKIWDDTVRRDLREMHEQGMDVLAGSDVGVINIYPGLSLHDEMALFVNELGMTPGEALDRATRRSAAFLGVGDSSGTVERGKIADLVILDADPLRDISNTQRIAAVVLRGRPFDQRAIEDLKTSVRNAPDRKVDDWGRTSPLRRPK